MPIADRSHRIAIALLLASALAPSAACGQPTRAGVVTTLEGTVTAVRSPSPQPVSLKFKDDVFLQDRITTGEQSVARLLLGGKAVVTIRERSLLTITEVPGRSVIALEGGKIGLAVARERMGAGETIEVRTPNAVAGVRGTVLVAEVGAPTAQAETASTNPVSAFYVLSDPSGRGVELTPIDPATRAPVGMPVRIGALQSFTVGGTAVGGLAPILPSQLGRVLSGLRASSPSHTRAVNQKEIAASHIQTAATLAITVLGASEQALLPLELPESRERRLTVPQLKAPVGTVVVNVFFIPSPCVIDGRTVCASAPEEAPLIIAAAAIPALGLQINAALASFLQAFPNAFIAIPHGSTINVSGDAFLLALNETFFVDRPLLGVESSSVTASSLVTLLGSLASSTTLPLIFVDPSTIITTGDLVRVGAGGALALTGSLLSDFRGTYTVGGSVLRVDGALAAGGPDALLGFAASTVSAQSLLTVTGTLTSPAGAALIGAGDSITTMGDVVDVRAGGTMKLAGPLLIGRGTFMVGGSLVNIAGTLAHGGPSFLTETNGTTVNAASWLRVTGTLTSGTGAGLLETSGSTMTTTGDLIQIGAPGNLTLARALVNAFGAQFTVGGNFLTVAGTLTGTGADQLIQLERSGAVRVTGDLVQVSSGGRLSVVGRLLDSEGSLTLGGDVLAVAGTLLVGGAEPLLIVSTARARSLLTVTGTLTSTTTAPLIFAGDVTPTGGDLLRVTPGGTLSLAGALLSSFLATYTVGGNVLTVDGTLTRNIGGLGALLGFFDSVVSAQSLLTVTGTLTSTAGTELINAGSSIMTTGDVAQVKAGGTVSLTGPLLVGRGTFAVGGSLVNIAGTLAHAGPSFLTETNGTTINASSWLRLTGVLTSPAGAGLLETSVSAMTTTGDLIQVGATGTLTLARALVNAFGASFTVGGNFLTVAGALTSTGPDTLIQLGTGTVQVTGGLVQVTSSGRLAVASRLMDTTPSLPLGGDVLAVAGTLTIGGTEPLAVLRGPVSARSLLTVTGTLTSTTTAPLFDTQVVTTSGDLLQIASGGSLSLAGLLLLDFNGTYSVGGNVLTVDGTLTSSGTSALLNFSGAVNAGGALVKASGRSTATTTELAENGVLMTTGSDQPIVLQVPLLETSGATMTSPNGVLLDNLLLQASAPLLNLRSGSNIATNLDALDLSFRAKVTSLGPVVRLSGSTLTINNGAAVNVAGGSILRVTGNLVELNFSSTLRTLNGPLLNVTGGSVANISNALVAFGGVGTNVVSVTNSLCATPCSTFSGIPVFLSGGATPANVTIGLNPVTGGTLTTSASAAVAVVNGATSKLIIVAP